MSKLELDKKHFIESDSYCFILKKRTGRLDKKTEEEITENIGYFTTLQATLKHYYLKLDIKKEKLEHVKDVILYLDKIDKKIDKIGEGIELKLWNQIK
ncbi:hypothetical protein [Aquibacillus saliphilus]|uniref:hypothetical protein n=1 Tax=Aquibacillus saliphilus TaxID=1909422 RepID=UPI001CF03CDB|nr:hypothetical protein [Aquibacillus saliphilus]